MTGLEKMLAEALRYVIEVRGIPHSHDELKDHHDPICARCRMEKALARFDAAQKKETGE